MQSTKDQALRLEKNTIFHFKQPSSKKLFLNQQLNTVKKKHLRGLPLHTFLRKRPKNYIPKATHEIADTGILASSNLLLRITMESSEQLSRTSSGGVTPTTIGKFFGR